MKGSILLVRFLLVPESARGAIRSLLFAAIPNTIPESLRRPRELL
jgi:hypothetical protein